MTLTYDGYEVGDAGQGFVETTVNRVSILDRVQDYLKKPRRTLLYDLVTVNVRAALAQPGGEP